MRPALFLVRLCAVAALAAPLAGCGRSRPPEMIAFSGVVHGRPGIYEVDAAGGHLRRIAGAGTQLAWSPDGKRLGFLRNGAVWTVSRQGGQPRLVVRGPVYEFSWSPDGTRIAYRGDDFRLYVAMPGGAVRRLTADGRAPAWSPDGRLVAFLTSVAHVNDQGEAEYVAVVRPDGSGRTRLEIGLTSSVAWSPDSTKLAFAAPVGGVGLRNANLYTLRRDGSDLQALLPVARFNLQVGDWSPDGRRIAFTDGAGTWVVDATGRKPHLVASLAFASWSSDGHWVAVHGADVIDVVPVAGGRPRPVVEAASIDSEAWRPSR